MIARMRILIIVTVVILLAPLAEAANMGSYQMFHSTALGFEFRYPATGIVKTLGPERVRIDLPFDSGTTLVEKYLLIEPAPAGDPPVDGIEIGGMRLWFELESEGAVGSIYDYVRCRLALGDKHQFMLTFMLHSVNPGMYASPPAPFDRAWEGLPFWTVILSLHRI